MFLYRLELRLAEQRVGQGTEADIAAEAVRQRSVFRIESRLLEEFAEVGAVEGAFLVCDVVFVQKESQCLGVQPSGLGF